jgi:hypothetical protein
MDFGCFTLVPSHCHVELVACTSGTINLISICGIRSRMMKTFVLHYEFSAFWIIFLKKISEQKNYYELK